MSADPQTLEKLILQAAGTATKPAPVDLTLPDIPLPSYDFVWTAEDEAKVNRDSHGKFAKKGTGIISGLANDLKPSGKKVGEGGGATLYSKPALKGVSAVVAGAGAGELGFYDPDSTKSSTGTVGMEVMGYAGLKDGVTGYYDADTDTLSLRGVPEGNQAEAIEKLGAALGPDTKVKVNEKDEGTLAQLANVLDAYPSLGAAQDAAQDAAPATTAPAPANEPKLLAQVHGRKIYDAPLPGKPSQRFFLTPMGDAFWDADPELGIPPMHIDVGNKIWPNFSQQANAEEIVWGTKSQDGTMQLMGEAFDLDPGAATKLKAYFPDQKEADYNGSALSNQYMLGMGKPVISDKVTLDTPASAPASAPVEAPTADDWPELSELKTVGNLGGSTGAKLVEDTLTGERYVMKKGASKEHLLEENAADELYRAAGIPVPDSRIYDANGPSPTKLARFIPGKTLDKLKGAERKFVEDELRKGFAVDALIGNWDVVGLNRDNVMLGDDGKVYRIDNGGSLRYRAMGAKKSDAAFGKSVTELESMRNPEKTSGAIFHTLKDEEVAAQIEQLFSTPVPPDFMSGSGELTPLKLGSLANKAGAHSVGIRLAARGKYLQEWANAHKADDGAQADSSPDIASQDAKVSGPVSGPASPGLPEGTLAVIDGVEIREGLPALISGPHHVLFDKKSGQIASWPGGKGVLPDEVADELGWEMLGAGTATGYASLREHGIGQALFSGPGEDSDTTQEDLIWLAKNDAVHGSTEIYYGGELLDSAYNLKHSDSSPDANNKVTGPGSIAPDAPPSASTPSPAPPKAKVDPISGHPTGSSLGVLGKPAMGQETFSKPDPSGPNRVIVTPDGKKHFWVGGASPSSVARAVLGYSQGKTAAKGTYDPKTGKLDLKAPVGFDSTTVTLSDLPGLSTAVINGGVFGVGSSDPDVEKTAPAPESMDAKSVLDTANNPLIAMVDGYPVWESLPKAEGTYGVLIDSDGATAFWDKPAGIDGPNPVNVAGNLAPGKPLASMLYGSYDADDGTLLVEQDAPLTTAAQDDAIKAIPGLQETTINGAFDETLSPGSSDGTDIPSVLYENPVTGATISDGPQPGVDQTHRVVIGGVSGAVVFSDPMDGPDQMSFNALKTYGLPPVDQEDDEDGGGGAQGYFHPDTGELALIVGDDHPESLKALAALVAAKPYVKSLVVNGKDVDLAPNSSPTEQSAPEAESISPPAPSSPQIDPDTGHPLGSAYPGTLGNPAPGQKTYALPNPTSKNRFVWDPLNKDGHFWADGGNTPSNVARAILGYKEGKIAPKGDYDVKYGIFTLKGPVDVSPKDLGVELAQTYPEAKSLMYNGEYVDLEPLKVPAAPEGPKLVHDESTSLGVLGNPAPGLSTYSVPDAQGPNSVVITPALDTHFYTTPGHTPSNVARAILGYKNGKTAAKGSYDPATGVSTVKAPDGFPAPTPEDLALRFPGASVVIWNGEQIDLPAASAGPGGFSLPGASPDASPGAAVPTPSISPKPTASQVDTSFPESSALGTLKSGPAKGTIVYSRPSATKPTTVIVGPDGAAYYFDPASGKPEDLRAALGLEGPNNPLTSMPIGTYDPAAKVFSFPPGTTLPNNTKGNLKHTAPDASSVKIGAQSPVDLIAGKGQQIAASAKLGVVPGHPPGSEGKVIGGVKTYKMPDPSQPNFVRVDWSTGPAFYTDGELPPSSTQLSGTYDPESAVYNLSGPDVVGKKAFEELRDKLLASDAPINGIVINGKGRELFEAGEYGKWKKNAQWDGWSTSQRDADLKKHYVKHSKKLGASERKAMRAYQNSSYGSMNGYLRGQTTDNYGTSSTSALKKKVEECQKGLMKGEAPYDMVVDHAMGSNSWKKAINAAGGIDKIKGKVLAERGFSSCSANYGTWVGSVRAYIRIPKGFPGYYLNSFSADGGSDGSVHPNEYEQLLPYGVRMRVVDAYMEGSTMRVIVEPEGFSPVPGEISPQS